MSHLALAVIALLFIAPGLTICLRDVFKRPQPSLSDTYLIGFVLLILGVLVAAV